MKIFQVSVSGRCKYEIPTRKYDISAVSDRTAAARAVEEFWKEPVNKKRKRSMQSLVVTITY